MKKSLLLLILPLIFMSLSGCDDEDDVNPFDLNLFAGTWEVVDQGNQILLERNCILNITSSQIHEGFGGYQGFIETYFITVNEIPKHDRVFTWSIREVDNHIPLLTIFFKGQLDSDNPWDGDYFYKITKLTDTHMWWQVNTNGDNSTIKFRRRNDIQFK